MKGKAKKAKKLKSKRISNSKLMFLSFILLFIIFEALYLLKGQQQSLQAGRIEKSVAGTSVSK